MQKPLPVLSARLIAALLSVFLFSIAVPAQTAKTSAPAQSATKQQTAKPTADDELMAKANALYYSSTKAGLAGFDCTVHPDWHALFVSASKAEVAPNEPRVVLLNSVQLRLHARMKGPSTIEWNQPADNRRDQVNTDLLDSMQKATDQTLRGFMQFWTPFIDGSAVPNSASGLEITRTGAGTKIHAQDGSTSVTEIMDEDLVLREFNVDTDGTLVRFAPTYKYTSKGLLVERFVGYIQPPGTPSEQAQELHVAIDYQAIDGLQIPSKLFMEVVGTGKFNFALDGCTVSRM